MPYRIFEDKRQENIKQYNACMENPQCREQFINQQQATNNFLISICCVLGVAIFITANIISKVNKIL